MKAAGVLTALTLALALTACGNEELPDTSDVGRPSAPVPSGLASGCPPQDTLLRLASGELPQGAVAVRVCPGAPILTHEGTPLVSPVQAPVDELTTEVGGLIDLVNDLPPFEPDTACTFDGGPNLVFWFRYPDGDARAVSYGRYGCHRATVGEGQVSDDAERLEISFADALLAQRAKSTPPRTSADAPECAQPPPGSVSPLPHVPVDLAAATVCRYVRAYRVRSAPVPSGLVRRLNAAQLNELEGEEALGCGDVTLTIEGVTTWGDRVSYVLPGDCLYAFTGDDRNDGDQGNTTFRIDDELVADLASIPLGPVQRWDP